MKIGIIGCGAIAREIVTRRRDVVALYDIEPDRCSNFDVPCYPSLDEFLRAVDFVVEAASPKAVRDYAMKVIENGKDMLIMSVGGLVDRDFREELFNLSEKNGAKIYVPSGAVGGLDIIRAAKIAGLSRARITTTKNCKTLGVECESRTLVFKGSAEEAIKKFPKSTNVTVLVMIATGLDVEVEVYADPEVHENVHSIYLEGEFGTATVEVRNRPSEMNPKTSYLAALSPVALLESLESNVRIGA